MRCLTLTQPWASLIAFGAKHIETRNWSTSYRGPLAIHAAVSYGKGGQRGYFSRCQYDPFKSALAPHLRIEERYNCFAAPLGAIVAVCYLTAVHRIPATPMHFPRGVAADHPHASYPVVLPPFRDDQERAFGDYTPGRFAWVLSDIRALPEPIPAKGAQGLWEYSGELSRIEVVP